MLTLTVFVLTYLLETFFLSQADMSHVFIISYVAFAVELLYKLWKKWKEEDEQEEE